MPGPAALTLEMWLGTHSSAEHYSLLLGESQFLSKTCNNCTIITLSSQLPLSQEEPPKQSSSGFLPSSYSRPQEEMKTHESY